MDLFTPLSDNEIEELDNFLLDLESDESVLNVSELDGLLTAVVSGPDMIPTSEWLEVVWGGQEQSPVWNDKADSPSRATQNRS